MKRSLLYFMDSERAILPEPKVKVMKRFPSLRKNTEYQAVYKNGRSLATGLMVMYVLKTDGDGLRLGISVSKKVGNSVVRHTFSRKIREIFRLNKYRTKTGYDIIIVARNPAKEASYHSLERDYLKLLTRHNIILSGDDMISESK